MKKLRITYQREEARQVVVTIDAEGMSDEEINEAVNDELSEYDWHNSPVCHVDEVEVSREQLPSIRVTINGKTYVTDKVVIEDVGNCQTMLVEPMTLTVAKQGEPLEDGVLVDIEDYCF